MSLILKAKHGEDLQVNAWHWRPTLELLYHERVLDDEQYERLGMHGAGNGLVDDVLAQRIADVLDRRLAAWNMKADDRMLADLSLTSREKTEVVFSPGGNAESRRQRPVLRVLRVVDNLQSILQATRRVRRVLTNTRACS